MKTFIKNKATPILLVVLVLAPIFRWFYLEPMALRFADFTQTMTSFGQIFGLLGMILFSINLIISNRSKFFDRIFVGLHRFYFIHKWLGTLAFSFLLFHPLFLAIKFLSISTKDAAMFLIPGANLPVTFGIIALLGMIIVLGITFYLKVKYHVWRFSHKFMVIVFIFAIIHTFLITSDISRDMFLRYYILTFALIGFFSGGYRAFFRIFFNKDYEFLVKNIKKLTTNVIEIELIPIKEKIKFYPGQFIFVRFVGVGISSEPHPFSITSQPEEASIKLVIKALGDFTNELKNVQEGTIVKIEGPFGKFYEKNISERKEIWVAGGVGITPFLSMARSLREINHDIDLFYCLNRKSEAVLLEELSGISEKIKRFKLFTWFSEEKGRISVEKMIELSGDLANTEVYLCGPVPFMRSLKDQLVKSGVKSRNVHFEEFNFL